MARRDGSGTMETYLLLRRSNTKGEKLRGMASNLTKLTYVGIKSYGVFSHFVIASQITSQLRESATKLKSAATRQSCVGIQGARVVRASDWEITSST